MSVDATPEPNRRRSGAGPAGTRPGSPARASAAPGGPDLDGLYRILLGGEFAVRETLNYVEEGGRIGLWAWDPDSDTMHWSRGLHAILGCEPGEVEPSHAAIAALTHPEDRPRPGDLERRLRSGLSVSRRFRLIRPNGRMRWVAQVGETLRHATGTPSRVVGLMIDVTDGAEAEAAATATQARFEALARASGAVAWTTDAEGGSGSLEGLDPAAPARGSRSPGPAMSVHPEDRAECRRAWFRARAETGLLSTECRVRTDGRPARWVHLVAAPALDPAGRVREWVWACFDIEERKRSPLLHSPQADGAEPPTVTAAQLRAARGCLNWSVRQLSESSGVSPSVIRRLEEADTAPEARDAGVEDLRRSLQGAGVEFLFPSSGKPGVRPR